LREAAHILATLVVAPYLALAVGFLLLGHAISRGTAGGIGGFLLALLDIFIWMVPWGVLVLVTGLLLVVAMYFSPGTRVAASAALVGISIGALAVLVAVPSGWPDAGQIVFMLPCAAAAVVGAFNLAKALNPGG
jgi:hypothetical protein